MDDPIFQIPLSKPAQALSLFALGLVGFMCALDMTIANVALPYIASYMGIEVNQGTYVITSYLIGESLGMVIVGWLMKRLGDVRLFQGSLILFMLFSWICAISPDIETIILARFIQGAAGGILLPLAQTLGIRVVSREKIPLIVAVVGANLLLVWALGPILGGWIVINFNWQWLFYINIPIGIISLIIIWYFLQGKDIITEKKPFDYLGFFFLFVAVISWQMALDKGQQWDWWNSNAIILLAAVFSISFLLFLVWEFFQKHPILELHFLKKRSFLFSMIGVTIFLPIDAGFFILIPLWTQTYGNYDAYWAGIALTPFGVGALFFALICGPIIRHLGIVWSIVIGSSLCAFACFYEAYSFVPDIDISHMVISRFLFGGGSILNLLALGNLFLKEIKDEDATSANGFFSFTRSFFFALGTSLFITLWERRGTLHHEDFATVATSYQPNTESYLSLLQKQGYSHNQAVTVLNQTADVQAATISFNDCFFLMGWLFVIAVVLFLLFMPYLSRFKEYKI